jgi:hypothetical protein
VSCSASAYLLHPHVFFVYFKGYVYTLLLCNHWIGDKPPITLSTKLSASNSQHNIASYQPLYTIGSETYPWGQPDVRPHSSHSWSTWRAFQKAVRVVFAFSPFAKISPCTGLLMQVMTWCSQSE